MVSPAKSATGEKFQGHHHRMGQASPSLAPRVTRLFQAKANVASSRAPMPNGTIRKLQDMLLTTTISGSMPACETPGRASKLVVGERHRGCADVLFEVRDLGSAGNWKHDLSSL